MSDHAGNSSSVAAHDGSGVTMELKSSDGSHEEPNHAWPESTASASQTDKQKLAADRASAHAKRAGSTDTHASTHMDDARNHSVPHRPARTYKGPLLAVDAPNTTLDSLDDDTIGVLCAPHCGGMHAAAALFGVSKKLMSAVIEFVKVACGNSLNAQQLRAFVEVVLLGRSRFLTGGAGTGKSFTTSHILQGLRHMHPIAHDLTVLSRDGSETDNISYDMDPVMVCASTGAAARHIGANTVHREFRIRFRPPNDDDPLCPCYRERYREVGSADGEAPRSTGDDESLEATYSEATYSNGTGGGGLSTRGGCGLSTQLDPILECRLERLQVLVIDEISMVSAELLNFLDRVLRYVRTDSGHLPFGGVQLLVVGDMFQLPPVVTDYDVERMRYIAARVEQFRLMRAKAPIEAKFEYYRPLFTDDNAKPLVYPFEAQAWKDVEGRDDHLALRTIELTEIMRQVGPEQRPFVDILHRARRGKITEDDVDALVAGCREPSNQPGPNNDCADDDAFDALFATNAKVGQRNESMLDRLQGDKCSVSAATFATVRSLDVHRHVEAWREHVETANNRTRRFNRHADVHLPASPLRHPVQVGPTHIPTLAHADYCLKHAREPVVIKVGARVRFTRNVYDYTSGAGGLKAANGEVGTIEEIAVAGGLPVTYWGFDPGDSENRLELLVPQNREHKMPLVRVRLDGAKDLLDVEAVRYRLQQRIPTIANEVINGFVVYQLPLKVAFARTFHTAQGQTIDRAVDVNLANVYHKTSDGRWTATPGAAYTALSRATKLKHIRFVGARRAHTHYVFFQPDAFVVDERVEKWDDARVASSLSSRPFWCRAVA